MLIHASELMIFNFCDRYIVALETIKSDGCID